MNDFSAVLAPKSDQINAMDLVGSDMTITITGVKVTPGAEQPVSISFSGSHKVWRPCKTTGRILMAAWGADTSKFVGRSVQLYLDPKVKWGGMEVGGIRIRALSHIDADLRVVIAESKQVKKPITVHRLVVEEKAAPLSQDRARDKATDAARHGSDHFRAWFNADDGKACRATGALTPEFMIEMRTIASGADNMRDRISNDPLSGIGTQPTDAEIEAQVLAELAARNAEAEGRA